MSTAKAKKKGMSREQAAELYKELQQSMAKMLKNEADYMRTGGEAGGARAAASPAAELRRRGFSLASARDTKSTANRGPMGAVIVLLAFAAAKVTLSALEYSGIASVGEVQATQIKSAPLSAQLTGGFSREEVRILTTLDARRNELNDRGQRLDEREQDIEKRDREFAARITQLRELSDKLNIEREKDLRKKSGQLDQLSNVYGSMNPEEAAKLIEQLDVTIALSLIERMPEKRIGQILAAMTPERALTITKMLSAKAGAN